MEEDKDIKKEIRDYLKEEADTHIRHWIAIKRESKRLYSDIEDRTKKIALKSSSLIKEEDFVVLHEMTHKIQMLNIEAVKVNSRLMFIIQLATSFGYYRLPWRDGRCVQHPGTYSPRHSDSGLLAIPTSWSRVADSNPNWDRF